MKLSVMLKATSLFGDMRSENILKLENICRHQSFEKKHILFNEEDFGKSFFLLASGKIQLSKISADGRQSVIKIVKPGEIFAEVVLDPPGTYPVTAQTLTASSVYAIETNAFFALLSNDLFLRDFIGILMRKQRFLTNRILSLTTKSVEQRLIEFLSSHFGSTGVYTMNMSKKDIAGAIGTTPESFSRLISRFEKEGFVEFSPKTIRINKLPSNDIF